MADDNTLLIIVAIALIGIAIYLYKHRGTSSDHYTASASYVDPACVWMSNPNIQNCDKDPLRPNWGCNNSSPPICDCCSNSEYIRRAYSK